MISSRRRMFFLGLGLSLALGGAGFWTFGRAVVERGAGEEHDESPQPGTLVRFEDLVVNLNESDGAHYLQISFALELSDEEFLDQVEQRRVPLRHQFVLFLSSLALADVQGSDQKQAIAEKLVESANEVFGQDVVTSVYFTKFVSQGSYDAGDLRAHLAEVAAPKDVPRPR